MAKAIKGAGFIKRLRRMLPQYTLLAIYKSFALPHLDSLQLMINQTKD